MTERFYDMGPRDLGLDGLIGSLDTHKYVMQIEDRLSDGYSCWRDPSVDRSSGSAIEGRGLFAVEDIEAHRVLAIKGGRLVNEAAVREMTRRGDLHGSQQQVGLNEFLVGFTPEEEDANLVGYNHSCDPNALIVIPSDRMPIAMVVSRRDIKASEEVTADYSVANLSNTHRLICHCGSDQCRGIIQPHYDWAIADIQARYEGEFPEFVQNVIDKTNNLPEGDRHRALNVVLYAGIAGSVRMLDDAVQVEKTAKVLQRFDASRALKRIVRPGHPLTPLESARLHSTQVFAQTFGSMDDKFWTEESLDKHKVLSSPGGVRKNLAKVVALARKVDELCAWIPDPAA